MGSPSLGSMFRGLGRPAPQRVGSGGTWPRDPDLGPEGLYRPPVAGGSGGSWPGQPDLGPGGGSYRMPRGEPYRPAMTIEQAMELGDVLAAQPRPVHPPPPEPAIQEPTGNLANILKGYGLHGSLNFTAEGPNVSDDMTRFGRGRVVEGTSVTGVGDPREAAMGDLRQRQIRDESWRKGLVDQAQEIPTNIRYEAESDPKVFAAVANAVQQRMLAATQGASAMPRPTFRAGEAEPVQAFQQATTAPLRAESTIADSVAKAKGALGAAPMEEEVKDIEQAGLVNRFDQPGAQSYRQRSLEEPARMRLSGPLRELEDLIAQRDVTKARAAADRFGLGAGAGVPGAEPSAQPRQVPWAAVQQKAADAGYDPDVYAKYLEGQGFQIVR